MDPRDYVCYPEKNCNSLFESIKNGIYPDLCSFDQEIPIFCCPPTTVKKQSSSKSSERYLLNGDGTWQILPPQ